MAGCESLLQIEYCTSGRFSSEKKDWKHQCRRLNSSVLLFGRQGTVHIAINDTPYTMEKDSWLLLPCGICHAGTVPSHEPVSYDWCHFTGGTPMNGALVFPGGSQPVAIPYHGTPASPDRIRVFFRQLMDAGVSGGQYAGSICTSLISVLLTTLAQTNAPTQADAKTAGIAEWLRINACHVQTVEEAAAAFGYNVQYLTTLLRKTTGKTLTEHITAGRMEKARALLSDTGKTVSQIAWECGYRDEKYFSRVFRTENDMTPSAFRQSCHGIHLTG